MNETLRMIPAARRAEALSDPSAFGPQTAEITRAYHKTFPEYQPTPLARLPRLAAALGVKSICVKDESYRFGLNAFKVLGGSFAVGCILAQRLGIEPAQLTYEKITSPDTAEFVKSLTLITATDGNHGRGIAWTANRLGCRSVVYMPKGSAPERLANIRALGAEAEITDLNYDDTVRLARDTAEKNGWVLVQDTAWEGYEEIPRRIMQGYTTMAAEALEQLQGEAPTHVFLQAGVGAMAGAVTGYLAARFGEKRPVITIVEPNNADCIFRTAEAADGTLHAVKGDLHTIMAGLACGEPCTIGWEMLRDHADFYVSMPDYAAANGMRMLGNPLPGDDRVISGESGAAAFGCAAQLLQNPALAEYKRQLGLDENSRILCFSTEGDTDRENYRRIVWQGLYPGF